MDPAAYYLPNETPRPPSTTSDEKENDADAVI